MDTSFMQLTEMYTCQEPCWFNIPSVFMNSPFFAEKAL